LVSIDLPVFFKGYPLGVHWVCIDLRLFFKGYPLEIHWIF
jgi:hypothetical protein